MAKSTFKTSQSKVNAWRKCRQAYHNKYVEKLRKRSMGRPLAMGRIIHEAQEADVNGLDPFEKIEEIGKQMGKRFQEEIEEYGDIVQDAELLLEDYYNYYDDKSLVIIPRGKQRAEHPFELELKDGLTITGKIDAYVKTPNKLQWLLERKNHKNIPDEDQRWRNLQSAVYTRINDLLGWIKPVEGMCWDYIRTKSPTRPQVLKNGQLSKRSLDTIPAAVRDTLRHLKLPASASKHLLDKAKENLPNYYKRIFTPTKKKLVDNIFGDFIETALEMRDLHGKRKAKTIGLHCGYCEFEMLCRGELQDLDLDYIKEKYYYVHTGKDNENDWSKEAST